MPQIPLANLRQHAALGSHLRCLHTNLGRGGKMGPLVVLPICPTTDESLENASAVYMHYDATANLP
jgi:hypothetical protein